MITTKFKLDERTISYIIRFLIGVKVPEEVYDSVGYTSDKNQYTHFSVIISPSLFFHEKIYGTPSNLPILPLKQIEGVPLLYGKPDSVWLGQTLVIYADIIASAFFMLSRYEELVRPSVRDAHGRFPGKESIAYRNGFISRPIVDEYGILLRRWLREAGMDVPEPPHVIKRIYLTHDLDMPFFCQSIRNVIREAFLGVGLVKALRIMTGDSKSDPFYTFPWLDKQAKSLQLIVGSNRCKSILFVRAGGKTHHDKPHYKLQSEAIQQLLRDCISNGTLIGLHSSYEAGKKPDLISDELNILEQAIIKPVKSNRHHYLSSREPKDMDALEKAGITDDFTMGYADVSGFRLGTSRAVRRIDPISGSYSGLTLHPLTIMDCSLADKKYMNMSFEEAQTYCLELIQRVKESHGELVLLWHNNMVTDSPELTRTVPWLRKLYANLIESLIVNA